jgi:hypothetical protein
MGSHAATSQALPEEHSPHGLQDSKPGSEAKVPGPQGSQGDSPPEDASPALHVSQVLVFGLKPEPGGQSTAAEGGGADNIHMCRVKALSLQTWTAWGPPKDKWANIVCTTVAAVALTTKHCKTGIEQRAQPQADSGNTIDVVFHG